MSSETETTIVKGKNRWVFGGIVGFIILFIALILVFGNPSAESVFRDMNEEMLQTKSVRIDQHYSMNGTGNESADIAMNTYMDFESNKEIKSSGDFSMDVTSDAGQMTLTGNMININGDNYVKFKKISSSTAGNVDTFKAIEEKLKGEWVKIRDNDEFVSSVSQLFGYSSTILPTPYANLTADQRKEILAIIQDKETYTIEESSNVNVGGVNAYKYELSYDEDQYNKFAKKLTDYVSYFKHTEDNESGIKSLTVWVNISTKQIIKVEFEGETSDGSELSGTMEFSDYNKKQSVEKPSDYSIESELMD